MKKPKYQDLKEKVEELVKNQFPSILFEALIEQHKRHGFKTDCKCSFCQMKMYYNHLPGWSWNSPKFDKFHLRKKINSFKNYEDII